MVDVSKNRKNRSNRQFSVGFGEQFYSGAPRWFDFKWNKHQSTVSGDKYRNLDREQTVRQAMARAHDPDDLFHQDDVAYLWTCVNPNCKLRNQYLWRKGYIRSRRNVAAVQTLLRDALGATARGENGTQRCKSCHESLHPMGITDPKDKWVYALKQVGQTLLHYREVHITDKPNRGRVASKVSNGRYVDRGSTKFNGVLLLPKNADRYTWHFFLSPVRLGKKSLALLKESLSEGATAQKALDAGKPASLGVVVDKKEQPWSTTVERRFSRNQMKTEAYEIIPLVDPFAWVAEAMDFDYTLILAAHMTLVSDANEQAKAFVAATLQQVIGRKLTTDNPPAYTENDKWDVKDETMKVPSGASGRNVAEAWTNRYRDAVGYLADETNSACARVTFVLRYSLAHRIVELACQEGGQEPRHLALALAHWTHILRDLPACNVGSTFVRWLTKPGAGSGHLAAGERVPRKNVMDGDEIKGNTRVAKEARDLPLLVMHSLCGAIMARASKPETTLKSHLANINVPTTIIVNTGGSLLTLDKLQSAKNLSVNISNSVLDNYIAKMKADAKFSNVQKYAVASSWKDRLVAFKYVKDFEDLVGALSAINDYSSKKRQFGTWTDEYTQKLDKVKAPITVAAYLSANTQRMLKLQLNGSAKAAFDKIEKQGTRAIATLPVAEYEAFIGSRTGRAYSLIGTGARVLAGPVGLLVGGAEAVGHISGSFDATDAGDPGASVGKGVQAAASLMLVAVAGAECAALVSGAAAAAWVGPLGWIAAGLMLLGAIIVSAWSKNDLELFASHSFLGKNYGTGDNKSGKAWLEGKPYNTLKYNKGGKSSDPYLYERLALTRLMAGFRTWIGATWYTGRDADLNVTLGGYVYPGFTPENAFFDVVIDLYKKGSSKKLETVQLFVWPKQKYYMVRKGNAWVHFMQTAFNVRALPSTSSSGWEWDLKVRLDLNGNQKTFLPASGKYLTNRLKGIYENAVSDTQE